MLQNNSVIVFVWKTSNNSRGRPNVKIDMNQVTNLKSLGFTWKKKANLLGVSTSFWSPCFYNCSFWGIVSVIVEADDLPVPTLWSSFLSPPLPPPLLPGNRLSNSCWTDDFWFLSISPFALFAKSIMSPLFFWDILTIYDSVCERDALVTRCLYCLNQ